MSQLGKKESLKNEVERLNESLAEANRKNEEALALLKVKTEAHGKLAALGQKSPITDVSLRPMVTAMGENLESIYKILNEQKQALKAGLEHAANVEQAAKVTTGFKK